MGVGDGVAAHKTTEDPYSFIVVDQNIKILQKSNELVYKAHPTLLHKFSTFKDLLDRIHRGIALLWTAYEFGNN